MRLKSKIMDILSQLGINNASFPSISRRLCDATKDASEDELKSVISYNDRLCQGYNIIGRKITISGEIEILLITYSDNTV